MSRFILPEPAKELVLPSAENIAAMFIGTPLEQSISDMLLSLCTDGRLTKTDDAMFVVNASTQSSEAATIEGQHSKDSEQFADWLRTLPFPLASILWLYHVRDTEHDMDRCEILLHFFEALVEFYAIVLLSAFQSDSTLYEDSVRTGVIDALVKNHQDLQKSSFGVWVTITGLLSKYARTLYNGNKAKRIKCEQLFGTTDKNMLNVLFNRHLIKEFQQTNGYRNSWSGHRGAVNKQVAHERLTLLEEHLLAVKNIFGETWKNFHLVCPGKLRYEETGYIQQVKILSGYSVPFQQRWIKTRQPMVYGSLYCFSDAHIASLRILPLIKVCPSPKTQVEACYFYNRVEGDRLRFISYHFEPEPEIYEDPSSEITQIINELLPQENSDENISLAS